MIEVTVDSASVLQSLQKLASGCNNPRPALLAIGEKMLASTKRRFNTSTAPDGSKWAANSPVTLARKKGTKPLVNHGVLRDQIGYQASDNVLTIFSTMQYAATQQFGAKRGAFGQTKNNRPIPWGDIPSRPFLGVSVEDEKMIENTVLTFLQSAFF